MTGIAAGDITGVTISIPQIGRLNTVAVTTNNIKLYDPNFIWDIAGSNYPVFMQDEPLAVTLRAIPEEPT
ncbi:MAG: hypothetical protein QNL24_11930 [Akkermansiaceae bacterium]